MSNAAIEKHFLKMDLMQPNENEPIKITQGDYGAVIFNITITCNGEIVDLTGNNVNMVVDNKDNVNACTVIDALNGVVEYILTQSNTSTVGIHLFCLELLTADSRVTTEREKYTVIDDLNK